MTQRRARGKLNRVDRWLYDHYGLATLDRSRVKEAVFQGQRLSQPALREAAHSLAGAVLALATGNSGLAGSAVAGFAGMIISVSSLVHTRRRVAQAHQVNG